MQPGDDPAKLAFAPNMFSTDEFAPPGPGGGGEMNAYDDDSSNSSSTRRMQCLVCGAPARGYNFGVTACESCKAFFRRNALRQEIRPCGHGGRCQIREDNRKACPACRINKCFDVGMKKELIHPPERLLMRAKPKSWQNNRRYLKSSDSGQSSSTDFPSGEPSPLLPLNASLQKRLYHNNDVLNSTEGSSKEAAQPSNQRSLLVNIIDRDSTAHKDGPSASNEPPASKLVDAGVMCRPLTDVDDTYYWLSSRFHYILSMAKEPFTYNPQENAVQLTAYPDTVEDGFAMYEYMIKRMVSTLVQMPHFNTIDRNLFIHIVKEKLFGAAQIFSCLHFNNSTESWKIFMSMGNGIVKEVDLECQTFFYNAFRYLTKPCAMSSVAILKMGDVDQIFKANMNCFKRICALSKGEGVFMIALIGYYLSIDENFLCASNEMNNILKVYEHYLMQLSAIVSGGFEICEFYRDVMALMQIVKWIEARYVDLGKYMEKDRLPPLLKEIMSNDAEEKSVTLGSQG